MAEGEVDLSTLGGVIKAAYEAQPNTNPFTDAEQAKLGGLPTPVRDDGTTIVAAPTALDFRGAGVVVVNAAGVAQVTIAGGGTGGGDSGGSVQGFVSPEDHGAVGDGVTNDAAAFDSVIAAAVASGAELRGHPGKVYRIATSLANVTGTLRISDCAFLAPNGVQLLRFQPEWPTQNTSVTGLTSTTIQGTTVTRVLLGNTAGLAVGDWVSVGSSTVLWPGEVDTRWFESARVVALSANFSLDLHRRLLGEEHGGLNANLRMFRVPDARLEAKRLRFEADGNPATTGQAGRRFAIEVRGGRGHRIESCHARTWWERFIRLSTCVQSQVVGCTWEFLPDIPGGNEAFGYGIQEAGACYGNLITGFNGGRCRHGYSSGGVSTSYDGTTPWSYGMPTESVVKGCHASGASGDCFDTHAGTIGITFDACSSIAPVNQPAGLTLPSGFQNRGYRTRVIGCSTRGGDTGFRDGSALVDWGAFLPRNIADYDSCAASEYDQDGMLLEGTAGVTDTLVLVNGLTVQNGNHGIHVGGSNRFDGSVLVRDLLTSDITGHAVLDDSGRAIVQVADMTARYTDADDALSPLRFNVIHASGRHQVDRIQVFMRGATSPLGLVQVGAAGALALELGLVVSDEAQLPILSTSSVGTLNVTALQRTWGGAVDGGGGGGADLSLLVSPQAGNLLTSYPRHWVGTTANLAALTRDASTLYFLVD